MYFRDILDSVNTVEENNRFQVEQFSAIWHGELFDNNRNDWARDKCRL